LKVDGEKRWRWRRVEEERFEKNNTHGLPLVKMKVRGVVWSIY
jgi:hypothetical protein